MSTQLARTRVPSQGRAVRTRAALLAAAEREFSARGYAATTARSIAERARTATGSFYQYFTCKDEALREIASARQAGVVTRALAMLEAAMEHVGDRAELLRDVRRRMRTVVDVVMAYHADDPGLHAVITERRHADPELEALIAEGERQVVERIAGLLARWGHAGDPTPTAFVLFGTLEGAVHAHVLGKPVVDDVRFIDALVEAMIRIASPASP
ncbi:MAG TPA: TetR/AcrR family transcriptional regulator [Kofleriaceae bacterium]|nr:TetR/AcrR family transcriptional regulator [Kofleriaceae bacterium]